MLNIVKNGSMEEIEKHQRQTKDFSCKNCGCIWEADKGDYKIEQGLTDKIYVGMPCPFCGKYTYHEKVLFKGDIDET